MRLELGSLLRASRGTGWPRLRWARLSSPGRRRSCRAAFERFAIKAARWERYPNVVGAAVGTFLAGLVFAGVAEAQMMPAASTEPADEILVTVTGKPDELDGEPQTFGAAATVSIVASGTGGRFSAPAGDAPIALAGASVTFALGPSQDSGWVSHAERPDAASEDSWQVRSGKTVRSGGTGESRS